jgi:hypothetical protein
VRTRRLALCIALVAGCAAAQGDSVRGEVRGSDGLPLTDAEVRVLLLPLPACPWRADLDLVPRVVGTGRTDAAGRFSVTAPARAALWIAGAREGALVKVAAPGVQLSVRAAPLAVLVLDASARGAFVRASGVDLGFAERREIAVPAGDVDLLVESAQGAFVASRRVATGERVAIAAPALAAARVRGLPAGATAAVWPWTARTLTPAPAGDLALPAARAPLRVRIALADGADRALEELWVEPGRERRWQPPALAWRTLRVLDADGAPARGALVVTLRTGAGQPSVASTSFADAEGNARWRVLEGKSAIAVSAAGSALRALDPASAPATVRLAPARAAQLRVADAAGNAVGGAVITTQIDPALDQEVMSDAGGRARLMQLPAEAVTIRVEHPDYRSARYRIDPASEVPLLVELERGLELHGVVTCRDPSRLRDAVLEIRDATGLTGMPPRIVAPDGAGRFVFRGLEDRLYTVFARSTRDGVTWSGMLRDVRPGEEQLAIELVNDDPVPGGIRQER